MPRHVAWFNGAAVEPSPTDGLVSADQTVSRRCLVPARALEELGLPCSVFGNLCDADPAHVSKHLQKLNTDFVVIGRIEGASLLKLARAAKHLGCYVIADFGDGSGLSEDAVKLATMADRVVVSEDTVAKSIHKRTGIKALVIPDYDERGSANSAVAIAKMWLDCFKQLQKAPPACANTNVPQANSAQ
jgi:hypothetical protein